MGIGGRHIPHKSGTGGYPGMPNYRNRLGNGLGIFVGRKGTMLPT